MDAAAEYVDRLRAGDADAIAALFDTYADRLHDLCASILRSRHEADDAVQDTFVLAVQRIGQLRDPEKLRPWLYAIARHVSYRRIEARARTRPDADAGVDVGVEPHLEAGIVQSEAEALVWEAAEGLGERDRTVLVLHLREGLDGAELAEALGASQANPYSLLTRLRDQLETSVTSLIVARRGREACAELDQLLVSSGWQGQLDPLLRKRVARHVRSCPTCTATRDAEASAAALLGATPLLGAAALRTTAIGRMLGAASSTTGGSGMPGAALGEAVGELGQVGGDLGGAVGELAQSAEQQRWLDHLGDGWTDAGFPPDDPGVLAEIGRAAAELAEEAAPPTPEPPSSTVTSGAGRGSSRILVASLVGVAVLVLAAVVALLVLRDDSQPVVAGPTGPVTSDPSGPVTTSPPAGPSGPPMTMIRDLIVDGYEVSATVEVLDREGDLDEVVVLWDSGERIVLQVEELELLGEERGVGTRYRIETSYDYTGRPLLGDFAALEVRAYDADGESAPVDRPIFFLPQAVRCNAWGSGANEGADLPDCVYEADSGG